MTLPPPYFFSLTSPLIASGGRIFQASTTAEDTGQDAFLGEGGAVHNLEEIAAPAELEALYAAHNKETVERFKADFAQQQLSSYYVSRDEIARTLNQNRTLQIIITDILPVLTAVRYDNQVEAALEGARHNASNDLEEIIDGAGQRRARRGAGQRDAPAMQRSQLDTLKRAAIAKVNQEYAALVPPPESLPRGRVARNNALDAYLDNAFDTCLRGAQPRGNDPGNLGILLRDRRIMRVDDRVYDLLTVPEFLSEFRDVISPDLYRQLTRIPASHDPAETVELLRRNYTAVNHSHLSRIKNKIRGAKVRIGGQHYLPLYAGTTQTLVANYTALIERQLKIETIEHEEFQQEQLAAIAQERERLERIVSGNRYEVNGAGFERADDGYGGYYIFTHTPAYALKSPHNGKYYKFKPVKFGVRVFDNGGGFTIDRPVVLENYDHPFLPPEARRGTPICTGTYNPSRDQTRPPGQAVLAILTKTQETFMMGYRTGSNPYKRLTDDYFAGHAMSTDAFQRSGLPCLNDFGERERAPERRR